MIYRLYIRDAEGALRRDIDIPASTHEVAAEIARRAADAPYGAELRQGDRVVWRSDGALAD